MIDVEKLYQPFFFLVFSNMFCSTKRTLGPFPISTSLAESEFKLILTLVAVRKLKGL